jgi:hypothetical protein
MFQDTVEKRLGRVRPTISTPIEPATSGRSSFRPYKSHAKALGFGEDLAFAIDS